MPRLPRSAFFSLLLSLMIAPLACAADGHARAGAGDEPARPSTAAPTTVAPSTASDSSTDSSQATPSTDPTTAPATATAGHLPHIAVDVKKRQVRVDCEVLAVDAPLEFFCVESGTSEHESVVRSPAKGSHLHLALLMIGLEPGHPVQYSESAKKWLPPQGPPLHIEMEWQDESGTTRHMPAYRWMRALKTKKEMPPLTWVFTGSRVMEDGNYAADVTGYLVSVVNFDLTVIDIPQLASSSNELLEWERNPETVPAGGTKATMVITPAGQASPTTLPVDVQPPSAPPAPPTAPGMPPPPTTDPATTAPRADAALTGVRVNAVLVDQLRQRWEKAVAPHRAELRSASQTHYEVIASLRREQQRIIDEADKIQRQIDEREKQNQDMTTPHPAAIGDGN
jgi:hypothetical protein